MQCPRCQQANPAGPQFCGQCGTPLRCIDEITSPEMPYANLKRALSEALEQQTATSEILRVISSSPTDLQPVMSVLAENAARLCDASDAAILRIDGNVLQIAVNHVSAPGPWRDREGTSRD